MKITDVITIILRTDKIESEADSSQDMALVVVQTDSDMIGIGEADSSPEVVQAVIDAPLSSSLGCGLRLLLIGEDPRDPTALWKKMYKGSVFFGRRGAAIHAMSAIDIALWDICGKEAGLPVHELLGPGRAEPVLPYASVLMPRTATEAAALARDVRRKGFEAVKFGFGPLGESEEGDVELVSAAREGFGAGGELMVDVGFAWGDAQRAIEMAKALEAYDLGWIEEPLFPDDLDGYRRLADAARTPIAAGEEETTRWGMRELMDGGRIDVAQPDVTRVGGFSEALAVAADARSRDIRLVPHAWSSPVTQTATLHFLTSLEVHGGLIEWHADAKDRFPGLVEGASEMGSDGLISASSRPGLGIELNWEAVQSYRVRQSHVLADTQ